MIRVDRIPEHNTVLDATLMAVDSALRQRASAFENYGPTSEEYRLADLALREAKRIHKEAN